MTALCHARASNKVTGQWHMPIKLYHYLPKDRMVPAPTAAATGGSFSRMLERGFESCRERQLNQ
jgi:hypothetical protein